MPYRDRCAHAAKSGLDEDPRDYIRGYTVANDVTARDLQKKDGQWSRAKGFDTFCPVGPLITDEDRPSPRHRHHDSSQRGAAPGWQYPRPNIFHRPFAALHYCRHDSLSRRLDPDRHARGRGSDAARRPGGGDAWLALARSAIPLSLGKPIAIFKNLNRSKPYTGICTKERSTWPRHCSNSSAK